MPKFRNVTHHINELKICWQHNTVNKLDNKHGQTTTVNSVSKQNCSVLTVGGWDEKSLDDQLLHSVKLHFCLN